ncbi:MAG: aldo/keto reductase [Candidatus Bathyarchaeota archaeon B24]|nr:MAG: aldo/keto reductase [Candidatus Bathyarchaeota archaeon B24]
MEYRVLGRTGFKVSIITLGGCGVGWLSQEEADEAVQLALKHGVNMVDVAPTYGEAEARLGKWVRKLRDKLFLTEKTLKRDRDGAWMKLNASLKKLGVKSFDLYQMHAVKDFDDLEKALEVGGAIEAFKEARETGLIRFIGITTHDVRVALKAIGKFDFDTVMIPIGLFSLVSPRSQSDFRPVLKAAKDRDVGVIAIKAIAKRPWKGEKRYRTWYEPLDEQEEIDAAVWFTLSQEGVAAYSLACDVRLWPMILDAAELFKRLNAEEQRQVLEKARLKGFEYIYTD